MDEYNKMRLWWDWWWVGEEKTKKMKKRRLVGNGVWLRVWAG